MIRASVSHTKNHLSALLGQVKAGETVLITDRDLPVAKIVPVNGSTSNAQIEHLAKLGLARLPNGPPLTADEILANRVETDAGVLDALLEERRSEL